MKKQLTYVAPLKAGIVLGVLYGVLSLIFVPFFLIVAMFSKKSGAAAPMIFGVGFAIVMPVIYAVVGFVGGIIAAALYNLIAKWTGGFEFETREIAPPLY
jgi:hypothetical protein